MDIRERSIVRLVGDDNAQLVSEVALTETTASGDDPRGVRVEEVKVKAGDTQRYTVNSAAESVRLCYRISSSDPRAMTRIEVYPTADPMARQTMTMRRCATVRNHAIITQEYAVDLTTDIDTVISVWLYAVPW